jgi:hypothetical protein
MGLTQDRNGWTGNNTIQFTENCYGANTTYMCIHMDGVAITEFNLLTLLWVWHDRWTGNNQFTDSVAGLEKRTKCRDGGGGARKFQYDVQLTGTHTRFAFRFPCVPQLLAVKSCNSAHLFLSPPSQFVCTRSPNRSDITNAVKSVFQQTASTLHLWSSETAWLQPLGRHCTLLRSQ